MYTSGKECKLLLNDSLMNATGESRHNDVITIVLLSLCYLC